MYAPQHNFAVSFINLKGIENQALLERTDQASQAERTQGEQGGRNLN